MQIESALGGSGPLLVGVPIVFLLFAAMLALVLVLHKRGLEVALCGLALIVVVRVAFSDFALLAHLGHEWAKLVNLLALLVGFALLADHFESSHLPAVLPRFLPSGALGGFALLVLVWLLSGVLDNIAAAMIGATTAARVFDRRVHLGYLAAIVASANAGGAGSVLGDTTTTMIWIDGVSPLAVLPAYLGAASALLVFGTLASRQQAKFAPMKMASGGDVRIDQRPLVIVACALIAVVLTNVIASAHLGPRAEGFPFMATALWLVLGAGTLLRAPNWRLVTGAFKGGLFLLALVLAASLMPVDALPTPNAATTLGMGFVSSVFDNIPLTKLALDQGGYDWGLLAYSVGFGGSLIWFGSSAGVAVAGIFPEAKSVLGWLRAGWHLPVAFVFGFVVQYLLAG